MHCFDTCFCEFFSNSSAQRHNWAFTVSSYDYFRITQSQNPLGCCLNWKSSSIPLQRTQSACIILLLLPRITSMGVAPTAIASASVSCLSSSSLLAVKKNRSHTRLLALHCNPRLVFCCGHFLTLPLHSNGTKIELDNDQSYAPQLPVSKASLVVVWLSYLPPCLQVSTGSRLFSTPFVGISGLTG